MSQDLVEKIRAAAQSKNIDPDIALAIAKAESSLRPGAQAGTSSAGGLFQVVDKTWKEFGGNPKKKLDADENIRVGTDIIAKNTQTLRSFLNRDPRPAEVYAAHYFGPSGAKTFLSADPATPIVDILGQKAVAANPNLKGKTAGQVLAQLETKMGSPKRPDVSRETPEAPARNPLPPSLPPMAATEESSVAPSRVASLGPGYQAALALSFLADTDDKEDRDIDREPGIAEKWMAQQPTAPSVMAQFADVSIKSPFAEPQKPQMLADGGEVDEQSAPDAGRPTVLETHLAKAVFPDMPVAEAVYLLRGGQRQSTPQGEILMGNLGARVPLGKNADAILMLAGSRPERDMTESKALLAAFNKRVGDEGGLNLNVVRPLDAPPGIFAGGASASYPLGDGRISGSINALKLPDQDPRITGYGIGYGGRVGPGNLSAQIMKQKDGPYSGQIEYRMPIGRADGGEVQSFSDGGPALVPRVRMGSAMRNKLEGIRGQYDTYNKDAEAYNASATAYDAQADAYNKAVEAYNAGSPEADFTGTEPVFSGREPVAPGVTPDQFEAMQKGAQRGMRNRSLSLQVAQNPQQFGFQMERMFADGGMAELTPEEIAAASKPAFLTPKSGIGRKISTKPGELEAAALQGVTEAPYLLAGAPVDLATMAMRPFGYDVAKPLFGSEDLKERALKAGIRQKPPEGKAARALYEMTQLGASAVNPAAPVRGAVKAAEKTGEAAKMLAQNFQQYNQQISVPGASYAVRNKGVPVAIMPRSQQKTDEFLLSMNDDEYAAFKAKNPDVTLYDHSEVQATKEFDKFSPPIDEAQVLADNLALTPDQSLNNWFMKALPNYLRTDFATNKDQLVMAAEGNKLLHLAPRKFSDSVEDKLREAFLDRKQSDLKQIRREEINYAEGQKEGSSSDTFGSLAKTEYGQRVEDLTDLSAYMDPIEALSVNRVPPSMRSLSLTAPETRVTDFSPDLVDNLQLDKMRDKMLEIRALGPKAEYSAYGQAPAKVPDEFLLPDDTLAKLNVAAASNRVARFTRWQDETRQAMATTALRSNPEFRRESLDNGKYMGVAIPDIDVHPKYMKLVTDVGCDGGWCTAQEKTALDYGSGDNQLFLVVTGEGKTARPVAQISVEKTGRDRDGNSLHSIVDIKEKGDTSNFETNPALPAIQEYVQSLDNLYGGIDYILDADKLGLSKMSQNPMDLLTMGVGFNSRKPLAEKFGSEQAGLAAVRDEVMKLNNGSQYTTGNLDDVAELVRQATRNVLAPQQRATGGMIERQSTDNRKYL